MSGQKDREELLARATELELDFPKNVKTEKLEGMIAEAEGPAVKQEDPQQSQDPEDKEPPAETPPSEPQAQVAAASLHVQPEDTVQPATDPEPSRPVSKRALLRRRIAEARKKAMTTRIVTLTNKDNRENDVMTTAHLSFENQHFGLSKIVPLDVQVELEQALIDIAESTRITLHKDEIVGGKRTGNKVPVSVKKFAISYSQRQTEEA